MWSPSYSDREQMETDITDIQQINRLLGCWLNRTLNILHAHDTFHIISNIFSFGFGTLDRFVTFHQDQLSKIKNYSKIISLQPSFGNGMELCTVQYLLYYTVQIFHLWIYFCFVSASRMATSSPTKPSIIWQIGICFFIVLVQKKIKKNPPKK